MAFGYSTSTSLFSRSTAIISDVAKQLISHLINKRKTEAQKQRPIIFVAHSFGGFVMKEVPSQGTFCATILKQQLTSLLSSYMSPPTLAMKHWRVPFVALSSQLLGRDQGCSEDALCSPYTTHGRKSSSEAPGVLHLPYTSRQTPSQRASHRL